MIAHGLNELVESGHDQRAKDRNEPLGPEGRAQAGDTG
jgi:hypothetical protein